MVKKKYKSVRAAYYKTHEGRTDGLKSNLKRHGPVVITDVHTRVRRTQDTVWTADSSAGKQRPV